MNGWLIFGLVILALIVILLAINAKDLGRYLRINGMSSGETRVSAKKASERRISRGGA